MVAYLASLCLYAVFLSSGKALAGRAATVLLSIGLLTHYLALLERARSQHTVPYHDLYGSMSLFGWLLGLTYLGLEIFHRQRSVGAYALPFMLAFFLASSFAPPDKFAPPPAHGAVFAFHVTLSILAYAAFALAFILSLIFLMQERLLREHRVDDFVWRLPPQELLDRMSQSSVLIGLVSIAIGTALGFVVADRLKGQLWYYDPKYVVTLVVLFLYVAYSRLARTAAWRGARASKLCIFNFGLVVFSFIVVNLFLSHSHRYF
jgi:ABC-type transport system involved in cytochrome c biogenesis permease subunit